MNGHCGGCRARAYGMTGDMMAEDPLCTHTPGTFAGSPVLMRFGAPQARPAGAERGEGGPASDGDGGSGGAKPPGNNEARLVARDDKKNPLISTFDWTSEAAQRILRVPAGFMRNKTQERIEELARERAAATIDLALVEDGIEIGKKMMAEMIATYQGPPSTGEKPMLNEVSPLTARSASEG